jgi:3'-phosphoadenosine 5'-phosphosulfate sulfotransferase (PAPS reductase)/FAD synthetase
MKDINVLSFSGGRTSAYMLYKYKEEIDLVIFCNTGKEAEGTLEFVRKCGEYFDKEIIWLEYNPESENKYDIVCFDTANRNGKPFERLIKKDNFLPNQRMRNCTVEMKAKTIKRYLKKGLNLDVHNVNMYLGIRKDEPNRYYKLKNTNRNGWENVMPLFKDNITKKDVLEFWKNQPFDLNIHSHEGNCDLCFLKGLSKKIELLREKPEIANWWIEMENTIGAKFNKNYSVTECLNMSKSQMNIFDNDIECFCNID